MPGSIFFLGVPRSGTTVLFEVFARHEELAWISNYSRIAPRWPVLNVARRFLDNRYWRLVGSKNQYGQMQSLNKLLPRPDESYEFWNAYLGEDFSRVFSPRIAKDSRAFKEISSALRKTRSYQNRPRLSAKMTGPARIEFLTEIFPDARFVHVIRDGMSVVHSLLNVGFWKKGGGLDSPWWKDGLSDEDISIWNQCQQNSAVLAALQWKRIILNAREEAAGLADGQYCEIRYDDFVRDPKAAIGQVLDATELQPSPGIATYLDESFSILDRGRRFEEMDPADIEMAVKAMQPLYGDLGYSIHD